MPYRRLSNDTQTRYLKGITMGMLQIPQAPLHLTWGRIARVAVRVRYYYSGEVRAESQDEARVLKARRYPGLLSLLVVNPSTSLEETAVRCEESPPGAVRSRAYLPVSAARCTRP